MKLKQQINKDMLKGIAGILGIVLLIGGITAGAHILITKHVFPFRNLNVVHHYKTAIAANVHPNVINISDCINVSVDLILTKDTAIMSVNSATLSVPPAILSGKPYGVGPNGEILVITAKGDKMSFIKVKTSEVEPEILILLEIGLPVIILSKLDNCTQIYDYLDAQAKTIKKQ